MCSRDNLPLISSALSEAEVEATPSVSPLTGTSDACPLLSQKNILCSNNEVNFGLAHAMSCCLQGRKMGLEESVKRDQDMINKAGIDRDRDGSVDLQMTLLVS